MTVNEIYQYLLEEILTSGDKLITRNAEVHSHFNLPNIKFDEFPLITLRKPAWKKAIREMEWFMSGSPDCPDELLDWWKDQLNEYYLAYFGGYGVQLRYSGDTLADTNEQFDQIKFILDSLKTNPNSRRLLMTTWNPKEMAFITEINENPNTPTCCHSIVIQFFVRNDKLSMKTYQRSADMLLGVPHNWIQSWAMLLYFAYHSNLEVGSITWMWGDAHIYNEESHITTAKAIIQSKERASEIKLIYKPESIEYDNNNVPIFKTSDFYLEGEIPEPLVKTRPKLL